jgi:hypothetical protein
VSINAPSDQSHQYTPVGTTPMFSVLPTVIGIHSASTVGPYEEKGAPPIGSSGKPERRFQCTKPDCGKRYAQNQGLMQHYRARHKTRPKCLYCNRRWNRPYQYRDHLKRKHKLVEDDIDRILRKPAGSRCTSKIVGRDLPQQLSPPVITVDHDPRSPAEARQRPLVLPLPAAARVTSVCPTAMSSVAHDLQSVYTEPTVMVQRHEDARRSEFIDATYPSAVLPSAEVRTQPDLNKSIQGGQIWCVHTFIVHDICDC